MEHLAILRGTLRFCGILFEKHWFQVYCCVMHTRNYVGVLDMLQVKMESPALFCPEASSAVQAVLLSDVGTVCQIKYL